MSGSEIGSRSRRLTARAIPTNVAALAANTLTRPRFEMGASHQSQMMSGRTAVMAFIRKAAPKKSNMMPAAIVNRGFDARPTARMQAVAAHRHADTATSFQTTSIGPRIGGVRQKSTTPTSDKSASKTEQPPYGCIRRNEQEILDKQHQRRPRPDGVEDAPHVAHKRRIVATRHRRPRFMQLQHTVERHETRVDRKQDRARRDECGYEGKQIIANESAPARIASFRENDDAGRAQATLHLRADRAIEFAHRVLHAIGNRQFGVPAVGEDAVESTFENIGEVIAVRDESRPSTTPVVARAR